MTIRIGRVERVFLVLLGLYIIASYFQAPGLLLFKLILSCLAIWVATRLARSIVEQMLWRLRNRLIVAYFFIALVPIILITALVGLGAVFLGGQVSVFLVTSELERRTNSLRNSVEFTARNDRNRTDWASNLGPFLQTRFPGVQVFIQENGAWLGPAGDGIDPPPVPFPAGSGLLLRDHQLYGWAHAERSGRSVMAVFPITRDFLGEMVPDIGECTVLLFSESRPILHTGYADPARPSHNRLPPAMNMMDREIWWGTLLSVALWEKPAESQDVWFNIRTRPSAVLRTVFTQKVDFANELIPMLFFSVAILFLIAELIALLIGISLTRTITGAVHELYEGTMHITRGDFSHRIPIQGHDQLTSLAGAFNHMTENMERLLVVEKERERLQAELEIAREVQNQLYPRTVPHTPSLCLTAVCEPARMVSGDYYDYQQLEYDRVAIAIGDVAGKGISAALLMATVQSSFRAQLRGSIEAAASTGPHNAQVTVSTSTVVSNLNQQLHTDTTPEKYATFFLGVYDENTSTLTYTNAGHLPPIVIRDGTAERLEVNGMVVGAFPFAKYDESRIVLRAGDLLVFFTDGITEPEDAYGEMFGEERLTDLALKNAELSEPSIIRIVTQAVRQWTGAGELQDDMTLLLVRRK